MNMSHNIKTDMMVIFSFQYRDKNIFQFLNNSFDNNCYKSDNNTIFDNSTFKRKSYYYECNFTPKEVAATSGLSGHIIIIIITIILIVALYIFYICADLKEKEQENLQLTDNISTKIQAFSFTSNQEEITAELENDENHSSYANYIFSGKHEAEYDHVDLESSKDDQLTEEDNLTTSLINKYQEPEYNFGQGDVIYEDVDPESSKDDQLTEEDNLTTQLINKKQEPEHNSVQAVALFEDRVDPEASKDDQLTEEDNVTTPIINKKQESEYNSEQVDVVFEDLTLNVDPESSKDDQLTEEDNLTTPLLINKKLELEYNSEQVVYEDLTLHVDPETSEDVSSNSKDHFTKLFRDKIQETEHNSEQVVDYENRTTQIFYKNFSTTECLNTSNFSMKNENLSANKKVYFKTEYGSEYQNSRTISSISKESVYSFQSAVCLKHFESNKMQVDEQKIESSDEEN